MRLTFSQACWLGSFTHSKNIVVLLSLHKWRLMSPMFAIPLKISPKEFLYGSFQTLTDNSCDCTAKFHVHDSVVSSPMLYSYLSWLHTAALSTEVMHAELTRTILETAELKWEDIWFSLLVIVTKLRDQVSYGCDTFASNSPWKEISTVPKIKAWHKCNCLYWSRTIRNFFCMNSTCVIWCIVIPVGTKQGSLLQTTECAWQKDFSASEISMKIDSEKEQ